MALGKQTPRQKMINLMYLVFIAMLALNMSKEVLTAFGTINTKLVDANQTFSNKNQDAMASLAMRANESPDDFGPIKVQSDKVQELSNEYYTYLQSLKDTLYTTIDDDQDYETMDQSNMLDEYFYKGGKLSANGKEFKDKMDTYRNGISNVIKDNYPEIASQIEKNFNTEDIIKKDGATKVKQDYVSYHFIGFPMISSITKLSQIQNDIKLSQNLILSEMLKGQLEQIASYDNYTTLLETTKNAFYQGETFNGAIVLGRKDANTKPNRVELKLDGRPLSKDQYAIEDGRVVLKVSTGGVGDHEITGQLIFEQKGEEVPVDVRQSFSTISKPNSATISADKMNVVYRGVVNPITISFAGIPDNKVRANAPGLTQRSGSSYNLTPGSGREVTINVSATLPDGGPVSDNKTFRIKDIPRPLGTIRGEDGATKMQRGGLEISTVGASLPDFDFDLNLSVSSFKFSVPGQPTVLVNGNKLDSRAKSALSRARRGETVQIFDIEAKLVGNTNYKLKKVSPIIIELTN